jgi:hypothetical protein
MDVLQQTQAVLDVGTNTLTFYRGLTAMPMTTAAEALKEFALQAEKSTRDSVEFVKGSLVVADTFATVSNKLASSASGDPSTKRVHRDTDPRSAETVKANEPTENEIDYALKRQKRKGGGMFRAVP